MARVPANADPERAARDALVHFETALAFESDCWDVHDALSLPDNARAKAFYRRFGGAPDTAWERWILPLEAAAR